MSVANGSLSFHAQAVPTKFECVYSEDFYNGQAQGQTGTGIA